MTEKQALETWELFRVGIKKGTSLNLKETPEQKKKRIQELEADPAAWKQWYFPHYNKHKSPALHTRASKRLFKAFKKYKHYYEVRHWARGLAKTTLTMEDVLFLVMTGQLHFIIYTSSTEAAAINALTKYQCELDSNDRLINDYGTQELSGSWTMGDFTTRNGVRFLALGARQSPRGESNQNIRPDCIIVDDFDTDEECRNPDIIDQKWDWFEKALFFTVDVASPYLIIWLGNIIAEDCCVVRAGKIADHCEIINIRDENGVSVWPEKNSEADIDYLLSKVSYEAGQQEYFNNPLKMGKVFKEMKYGKCPPLRSLPFVVSYADPATSNKDRPALKAKVQMSSKCVAIIGSLDGITFYVYKVWLDAVKNSTFVDWLYASEQYIGGRTQNYPTIENNSLQDPFFQQVLNPLIYQRGKELGAVLPVHEDTRVKPEKYYRIEGTLEPLNRNGNLILNEDEKDDPHMKRLEAQFKSVSPNSKTMDGPDAIEGGVTLTKSKRAQLSPASTTFGYYRKNSKRF